MTGGEPASQPRFPIPSSAEWFYLILGIFLVVRYAWFFDDSFIYYRYVDNLLFLDIGLTFNAGEFVEGYTSPLHTLTLILLRSLHLSYPTIVLILGITCFVAMWYLLVAVNRERSPGITRKNALNFPLAYLAVNYAVASFFTSGNESALVHVVAARMPPRAAPSYHLAASSSM